MDIDLTAPIKSSQSLFIDAPQHRIWDLLTSVNQWPKHFSHISSAHMDGAFEQGLSFTWKSGGVKITSTIQEIKEHLLIGWTGKAIGTQAVHVWRLTPQVQGTLLETSESMSGWLIKIMPGLMQKTLDKTLHKWLQSIKKLAEVT